MRLTIKGLRRWIMLTGALLVVVVAGFVIYGRNRYRHIEKDLPARLGINIQQSSHSITFSQSSQGHTLFTLKAARQVQLKSGHVLLHDVDITLYGPPGSGRADRIYGSDFDYDQKDEIATSQGEVNIELNGMGSAAPPAAPAASGDTASSNTVHVRTRGLTFVQKTGEAITAQPVEFQLPRAAGSSVGADYNSKSGVLVLDSQVRITTSSNGRSAVVQAGHATLLRASMQAFLVNATLQYETESGSADHATVFFRKDGTTQRVDASGHVHMTTDTGAQVNSATARILMDTKSQPTQADLGGGVTFASARDNNSMHGSAREGTLLFATAPAGGESEQTVLRHAQFRQDVAFTEDIQGLPRDPAGHTEKQMQGQIVNVDFAVPAAKGQVEARKAVADGNPVVTTLQMPSKGPQQTTRISGDHLVATLGPGNTLQQLDGTGHTRILDESTDGARDTSQGDILHTTFVQQVAQAQPSPAHANPKPPTREHRAGKPAPPGPKMQTTLQAATQDGHVVLTETPAKKPGETAQPATLTGWAGHAEYHAADQVLHLTESPRITDSQTIQLSGNLIDYHRDTQNAQANGNVKATYLQPQKTAAAKTQSAPPAIGGTGPVHVIADRAAIDHARNITFFYGTVRSPARMWQGANSLLAPLIEIDRNQNLLKARNEGAGSDPVVDANFTSAMGPKHEQSVVRVHSQTLVYSDKDRRADFHGAVTAEGVQGTIHSDDSLVYLKPASAPGHPPEKPDTPASAQAASPASAPAQENSQIDRIIDTGHVVFLQPGRRGEGEKLVYTADNGRYVLTGTPASPPKMWDRVRGTTTGVALIFNSQDDSVEVSGGKSSAVTETRVPK